MKKIVLLLTLSLLFPITVLATGYNTSVGNDIGYNGCRNFQDSRISGATEGYFGHCKKATCYTGMWVTEFYISSDMITCANGNRNYYVQTINSGCEQYKGTCTPRTDVKYCSVVTYYDCSKTKDGKVYVVPTTTTTTKPTTTTTTTKKTTTTSRKVTTKSTTTTTTTPTTTTTTTNLDSNNYLSSLKLSVGDIDFKKEIIVYNIEVAKTVKSIDVTATTESSKANLVIENNLEISESKPITITVTAEDETVRVYTINIKYKEEGPVLSSNNLLESIEIKGYNLKFDPKTYVYTLKLENDVEKLDIKVVPQDSKSEYIITGNSQLKNKSKIIILVTAENGEESVYSIKIKKTSNLLLYILGAIVAGVALVFGFKLIKRVMPAKKDKGYDYE